MSAISWQQTHDRATWRAARGLVVLTVSKLTSGQWSAAVEGPGVTERPLTPLRTRLIAQRWCENRAGVAR
jgi:hypothetical protein